MNKHLTFNYPAAQFTESTLLGNGFLGAAVYGGIDLDRYSMNEATLWSGFPQDVHNAKAVDALKKAKDLSKDILLES